MITGKNKIIASYEFIHKQNRTNILKMFTSILLIVLSTLITIPVFAQNNLKPGDTFHDCKDCPEMVVIPAGNFIMGSPDNEPGRVSNPDSGAIERPQRLIKITSFAAGKFDITKEQWASFVKETNRITTGAAAGLNYREIRSNHGSKTHPLTGIILGSHRIAVIR
ncbi:MAG: SUMF1/EgtB/PvdO family nonheme iron enzyme [Segetibacter sp.]